MIFEKMISGIGRKTESDNFTTQTGAMPESPMAYIGDLQANTAFIKYLYANKVEIRDEHADGYIKSAGFVSADEATPQNPAKGFIIRWNGDCEFNDGKFRGELQARYIRITGTVSSGTQYLLRASSMPAEVQAESGWIAYGFEGLLKEIRTLAQGSCLLRMKFPRVAPVRVGDINRGNIRITVNDNTLSGYSSYWIDSSSGDITLDVPNVPLTNVINTIRLYGSPYVGGNMLPAQSVINTLCELRCAQDPGFLGAIG